MQTKSNVMIMLGKDKIKPRPALTFRRGQDEAFLSYSG